MKIAVCDDEVYFLQLIREELEKYYKSMDVSIALFSSGGKLAEAVEKEPYAYACVFLDIEMPGMSGIETAQKLRKINERLPVILLTSHVEYAIKGYEIQAFRFLRKPVEKEELYRTLEAVERQKIQGQKLAVSQDGQEIFLPMEKILYIRSENVYLSIVMAGEETQRYLIRSRLKELLAKLPHNMFFQVHRSYIINLGHVDSFDGKNVYLSGKIKIPVSRRTREELQTAVGRYLRKMGSC